MLLLSPYHNSSAVQQVPILLLGEQGEFFSREPEPGTEPATSRTVIRCSTHETTSSAHASSRIIVKG